MLHSTISAQRIALGDLDDIDGTSAPGEASKSCKTSHALNSSESSFMSLRGYVPISVILRARHRHEGADASFVKESAVRKIITTTFVTMDGVMQAPGGPEEDTSGGFKYGGWQAKVMDDSLGEALNEFLKPPFAMLLGRTTYDIFAGFWPKQDPSNAIAKPFNEATKYVVSHEPFEPGWANTKVVSGDVPGALRKLKAEDGPDMIVWGSGNLIQTLLREKLVDCMHVWTHPVTIGAGKRLFADGTRPATWKLVKSRVGNAGVIIATYEPAGELVTGTMGA